MKTFADLRRAGFNNVSFDLIAGLLGQTLAGWQRNIKQALDLRPEHLFLPAGGPSGTPLAEHIRRGIQPEPDDDLAGVMYQWMLEASQAGYEHYETRISASQAFTRGTTSSIGPPNLITVLVVRPTLTMDGLALVQSSRRFEVRGDNRGGLSPVVEEQQLSQTDVRAEALFLGMRLMRGIDLRRYRESFGVDLRDEHARISIASARPGWLSLTAI